MQELYEGVAAVGCPNENKSIGVQGFNFAGFTYIVSSLMQDVPSGVTLRPLAAIAVSKKPAKTSLVMPTPTGIPLMCIVRRECGVNRGRVVPDVETLCFAHGLQLMLG